MMASLGCVHVVLCCVLPAEQKPGREPATTLIYFVSGGWKGLSLCTYVLGAIVPRWHANGLHS
jgi:hypothetical protein